MSSAPRPLPEPVPHIGPILDERRRRQRFDPNELAVVLSHYELGVIEKIHVFPRGSPRAPKVRVRTHRGEYLLKRRAPGRDDPQRVAFAHGIQISLSGQGYPVPRLVGTREGNNSMLQLGERIYELFEFSPGRRYDGSPPATERAGAALATLHRLLADYRSPFEAPQSSYHGAAGVESRLARIPDAVSAQEPKTDVDRLRRTCSFLGEAYREAADRVDRCGFGSWPRGIVHGDWHPGNLLFAPGRGGPAVAAVLDFDSARLEPPVADVANAALQFSMRWPVGGQDPARGPLDLDLRRLRTLVRGYDHFRGRALDPEQLEALPWLMTEALVLESVIPIAATGTFGHLSGSSVLQMVEGKVQWMRPRAQELFREASEGR